MNGRPVNPRSGAALPGSAQTPLGGASPVEGTARAEEDAERAASDREDQQLVRRFLSAEAEADRQAGFAGLYEKYRDRIFAVLLRTLRDRDDALEGTQEVFIKIHRALDRYDPRARFFTWVYRIAMNHAIDRIRRRKVRKEQVYDETYTEPRNDSATDRFERAGEALEAAEVRERIAAAVGSLGEKHRSVFVLFSYEGLGYAEIAETLDIPVGTVMSRLYHARRKVREQLPPDWDPGGPDRKRENYRRRSDESEGTA